MEEFKKKLLLDENAPTDENALVEEFMKMYGLQQGGNSGPENPYKGDYKTVNPVPQFCVKTKSEPGEKIFLNFCTAEHVPAPRDITQQELIALLDSEDPSQYRVPMSLGEPHAEVDKSGHGCTAYDIVINKKFSDKIQNDSLFMGFFMSVIMEGLDNKYEVKLSREWVQLKNKKSMGQILPQHIRAESKPWIMEMDPSVHSSESTVPKMEEVKIKKAPEPKFKITQDPPTGHPDFLIAEIELPNVRSSQALTLDLGEDRIVLETRSKLYYLDVYLPFNLVQADCGAQFNKQTNLLTVTMPVQPVSASS